LVELGLLIALITFKKLNVLLVFLFGMVIRFLVSGEDKKLITKKAASKGYKNVSAFLRDLVLKD